MSVHGTFGFDLAKAKALPYSSSDDPRQGKRVAAHAFHETYLPIVSSPPGQRTDEDRRVEQKYYASVPEGFIAAEIDRSRYRKGWLDPINRVFLANAMPVDDLRDLWRRIADLRQEE